MNIDIRETWETFGLFAVILCAFGVIGGAAVAGFGITAGATVMLYALAGLVVSVFGTLIASESNEGRPVATCQDGQTVDQIMRQYDAEQAGKR